MEGEAPVKSNPFQFTLRTMFVVMTTFALLLGLLVVPIIRSAEKRATRDQCSNNLKQIGIGLLAYESANGCFPAAYSLDVQGRPMHSWRARAMPFLESNVWNQSYKWDEPWDGPNNAKLLATPMSFFSCPADLDSSPTKTSYVAVVGTATPWPGDKSRRSGDFTGSRAYSAMVVEATNSGIHWMEPRDLEFAQVDGTINRQSKPGISSAHGGGANMGFADGAVHFISENADPDLLKKLLRTDMDLEPDAVMQ